MARQTSKARRTRRRIRNVLRSPRYPFRRGIPFRSLPDLNLAPGVADALLVYSRHWLRDADSGSHSRARRIVHAAQNQLFEISSVAETSTLFVLWKENESRDHKSALFIYCRRVRLMILPTLSFLDSLCRRSSELLTVFCRRF